MTTPPPDPGRPAPLWNRPPAGLDWPAPGQPGGPPPAWYPAPGPGPQLQGPQLQGPQLQGPQFHGPPPYESQPYRPQPYGSQSYGPQPTRGTNGFAVAALVLGILPVVPLGAVFGGVALSQIRRTGQDGRGLAIAGLLLSGLWIVLIALGAATSARRADTGDVTSGGTVSSRELRLGDCLNNLRDNSAVRSFPAVPCAQPHEGEVFAVFDLRAGPYPGQSELDVLSETGCNARFGDYAPADLPGLRLYVVYPLEGNWSRGDHQVTCIATPSAGGRTTGSIRTG